MVPRKLKPRLPPFPKAPPAAVPRCSMFSLCLSKILEISSVFGILGICFTTLASLSSLSFESFDPLPVDADLLLLAFSLLSSSFLLERDEEDPDC